MCHLILATDPEMGGCMERACAAVAAGMAQLALPRDSGRVAWPVWDRTRKVGRLFRETRMKAMRNLLAKLVKDEQGGEVLEYALIAGLIVVAAIAVIGSVGTKVLARWTALNSSL